MTKTQGLIELMKQRMTERFGNSPASFITERFAHELYRLNKCEGEENFLIMYSLAQWMKQKQYPFILRNVTPASFLLYLLDISSVNPLPAYYYCSMCHRVERVDGQKEGFDLPPKKCGNCGADMESDGHSLAAEIFWGAGRRRLFSPSFFVMVPAECKEEVHEFLSFNPISKHLPFERFQGSDATFIGPLIIEPGKNLSKDANSLYSEVPLSVIKKTLTEKAFAIVDKMDCPDDRKIKSTLTPDLFAAPSFQELLLVYHTLNAVWKENADSDINTFIMREDVYDFYISLGFGPDQAYDQMYLAKLGRGISPISSFEEFGFVFECNRYRYLPSKAEAVEYFIKSAKRLLKRSSLSVESGG